MYHTVSKHHWTCCKPHSILPNPFEWGKSVLAFFAASKVIPLAHLTVWTSLFTILNAAGKVTVEYRAERRVRKEEV
jgi:hypothetical protein